MAADKAVAARVLKESCGWTVVQIAEVFSVTDKTVYKWLSTQKEAEPEHSAVDDLEALLSGLELDDQSRMNAGIARRLATKLDRAAASDKAQDSMAIASISKELRSVVDAIMGSSGNDGEWLADVFA